MQEELVKFETAKLAKEKGFDISCQNIFVYEKRINDVWVIINHYSEKKYDFTHLNNCDLDWQKNFLRPSQSLLQKWLREGSDIHIEITRDYEKGFYLYQYFIDKNHQEFGFNSYEKALEAGLQEGLKLIKT